MSPITTQKHDFIFKTANKRVPILPRPNIEKPCGNMEKETIQKLSFPTPIGGGRPTSFKPVIHYQRPQSNKLTKKVDINFFKRKNNL